MINAFQNIITLTRGDDCVLQIDVTTVDGNEYTPAASDVIKLYVKKHAEGASLESQTALITKTFNADQMATISSSDTKSLDLGTYKYGVVLTRADGTTSTIISPTDFVLAEGIT